MPLKLPPLPYAYDSLEPHISAATITVHHDKHHGDYVEKVNRLVEEANMPVDGLESIIMQSAGKPQYQELYNNAAQAWNHDFYWRCMKPGGGGEPHGEISGRITSQYNSYANFVAELRDKAIKHFGSGWTWVVLDDRLIQIVSTSNADTPLVKGQKPLFAIDVWEHAYYLDYQNMRADYVSAVIAHLINWDFVNENLNSLLPSGDAVG